MLLHTRTVIIYVSGRYDSKRIKLQQGRSGLDMKKNVQTTEVLKKLTEVFSLCQHRSLEVRHVTVRSDRVHLDFHKGQK